MKMNTVKKIGFLIMALVLAVTVQGGDEMAPGFTFNHVALSVKDVNISSGFYESVFGLQEIANRTEVDGIRWLSLGEGKELHLISTLKEDVKTNRAVHFALTTADFDSFITRLDGMNIKYSDFSGTPGKINIRADGIRQIFLQDPDGYWIEINQAE